MEMEQNYDQEMGMTQEKLPNTTTAMVLGIISFICCCFSSGIGGLIFSGIALIFANKDKKLYEENPEFYYNYNQLKTARIIAIIGLILGAITLITSIIYIISMGGFEAYMEQVQEMVDEIQDQME